MRRIETKVTSWNKNQGMHDTRAFSRAKSMLDGHGYKRPRLYHLVLKDGVATADARPFQLAIKDLCQKLRYHGIDCRWRGCLERDDEKGLHFHLFMLCDATAKNTDGYINTLKDGFLREILARHGITFHLARPEADLHRSDGTHSGKRRNYAQPIDEARLADCIEWISYLCKARSKPGDIRGIYFSSRDSKAKPRPALA